MLPSFLPFLAVEEGGRSQCWFVLLPTCVPHAHELSLFQAAPVAADGDT